MEPGDLVIIADRRHTPNPSVNGASKDGHGRSIPNGTVGIFLEQCKDFRGYYDVVIPSFGSIFEVEYFYVHNFENYHCKDLK